MPSSKSSIAKKERKNPKTEPPIKAFLWCCEVGWDECVRVYGWWAAGFYILSPTSLQHFLASLINILMIHSAKQLSFIYDTSSDVLISFIFDCKS
jgi:hypothetical protein